MSVSYHENILTSVIIVLDTSAQINQIQGFHCIITDESKGRERQATESINPHDEYVDV